jgi:hypothetical protein
MSRLSRLTRSLGVLAAPTALILALLSSTAATAGAPVGAVTRAVPAFARAATRADRIPSGVARKAALRLRLASSRRIAASGGTRVFVAPSLDGKLVCLVSSSTIGEVGTACSPPATFTAGVGFAVLIADRGPATPPTTVLAAANARVRALVLTFESSSRRLRPNVDGGVAYIPPPGGGRLVSISSVDASGRTIGTLRVPTG